MECGCKMFRTALENITGDTGPGLALDLINVCLGRAESPPVEVLLCLSTLRATKEILQDVDFGARYVWISGTRRMLDDSNTPSSVASGILDTWLRLAQPK
jgi:hypothetical protein